MTWLIWLTRYFRYWIGMCYSSIETESTPWPYKYTYPDRQMSIYSARLFNKWRLFENCIYNFEVFSKISVFLIQILVFRLCPVHRFFQQETSNCLLMYVQRFGKLIVYAIVSTNASNIRIQKKKSCQIDARPSMDAISISFSKKSVKPLRKWSLKEFCVFFDASQMHLQRTINKIADHLVTKSFLVGKVYFSMRF